MSAPMTMSIMLKEFLLMGRTGRYCFPYPNWNFGNTFLYALEISSGSPATHSFPYLGAWIYTEKAHSQYHVVRKRAASMNSKLQDSISGIRETLSFNRQLHEVEQFEKRSRDYCEGTLKVMRMWAIYSPTMMFLGSLGTVLILLFGADLCRQMK
ncbi:MAG: hypothetical protein CM1200mP16_13610 [Nitrospina sp.]|nr:MAG: hypothetical protein CM1200mP16_13610 [Nitrospina sp.]